MNTTCPLPYIIYHDGTDRRKTKCEAKENTQVEKTLKTSKQTKKKTGNNPPEPHNNNTMSEYKKNKNRK